MRSVATGTNAFGYRVFPPVGSLTLRSVEFILGDHARPIVGGNSRFVVTHSILP